MHTDVTTTEEPAVATSSGPIADRARGGASSRRKPRLLIIGPLPPPPMGPAIATERMMQSEVMRGAFDLELLDISDRDGQEDIGRLNWGNVSLALRHAMQSMGQAVRFRPDVVYISIARGLWGFVRDIALMLPLRLSGAKVLVHLRAGRFDIRHDHGAIGRAIARFGLAGVARAIVLGETVRDVYGPTVAPAKIRIVPNGMNLQGWNADLWRRERGRRPGLRIAYVANLYPDKGLHILLDALLRVRQAIPDVMVMVGGDWFDRDYERECMEFIAAHRLEGNVRFLGRVNDAGKRELLAAADVAAFVPVKPEGMPWVVLEAMAAGLPVIGTPQGTMKELIVEGETGYLVPVGDSESLAERILRLGEDRELRDRMGRNARKRIEEVYAEPVTHRKLVETALEVLRKK